MAPSRRLAATPAPVRDVRDRLLQAGLALAEADGLKAVTVRAVARRAEANLGSFVYHFGTRDAFIAELIERWYQPMFDGLQLTAQRNADDPLASLQAVLRQLVAWVVAHRSFLAGLLMDAGSGEGAARRFLQGMDQRHPALLMALLQQAQRRRQVAAGDPGHQLLFLLGALALPLLAVALAARGGTPLPPMLQALDHLAGEPEHVAERVRWALQGLAPRETA